MKLSPSSARPQGRGRAVPSLSHIRFSSRTYALGSEVLREPSPIALVHRGNAGVVVKERLGVEVTLADPSLEQLTVFVAALLLSTVMWFLLRLIAAPYAREVVTGGQNAYPFARQTTWPFVS